MILGGVRHKTMALLQDDGDDGADDDGVDDDDYGSGDDDDDDGSAETQHWECNVLCFYRKSLALNSFFHTKNFFDCHSGI